MKNSLNSLVEKTLVEIINNSSFRFFEGGGYGVNFKNTAYYFLDELGAYIIKQIISNKQIDTENFAKEYGTEESIIINDFTLFLEGLIESNFDKEKNEQTELTDENFLRYFTDNKIPLAAIIEITEACNEKCIHCYRPEPKKEYWTLEKFEQSCVELAQLGSLQIDFTGGEPFLKKNFKEYLTIADRHGFIISILSNATLITEDDLIVLSKIKLRSLYISLYSADPVIHDAITKLPGSFKKTIDTIIKLKSLNLPIFINSPIMEPNKNCPANIKNMVEDLGLEVKFTYKISESYSKKRETKKLNVFSKDEMQKMINNSDVMLYSDIIQKKSSGNIQNRDRIRSCDTGFRSITISPEGDVIPCTALRMKCGNIAEHSLHNIWTASNNLNYWREEGSLVKGSCKTCDSYDFCEPCPAGYFSSHGNLNGIDDLTCGFGKAFSSCVSCS